MGRWNDGVTFRIITRYEKAAKPQVTVIIPLHHIYVTNSKIRYSYREAMTHTKRHIIGEWVVECSCNDD